MKARARDPIIFAILAIVADLVSIGRIPPESR